MTLYETEAEIARLAQDAVNVGLSRKTTETMIKTVWVENPFVKENLGEILDTVDALYEIVRKD